MAESSRGEPDVRVDFGHDALAPRRARKAIEPLLREGGQFADDVTLAASEVVSNVVLHTHDGGRLEAWDDDPLVFEVQDFDPIVPAPPVAPRDNGGRGLAIVDHVADEWGVEPTADGKKVWAKFRRPDSTSGDEQ
ncbi:MAG: ATP-binding protein [Acidimicrobiales bacterium]